MTGFRVADRVKETSTTTGTGTLTLAGAVTGFQSFNSGIGDGSSTTFVVEDGTNWEVYVGKYTHSGTTLSRDTLIASSTGSAISWSAGTRNVFISEPSTAVLQGTVVKTASYTALASDSVILCNPAAAMTITLPSAASATLGIRYLVKKIDTSAYVVTISDGASAHVDHASSSKLYLEGDSIELVCAYNGSGYEWLALSRRLAPHAAKMKNTASQTTTDSAFAKLEFNTVVYEYGADADIANERIQVKRAGRYNVFGSYGLQFSTVPLAWLAIATVTGTGAPDGDDIVAYNRNEGTSSYYLATISTSLELAADDYLYLMYYHDESAFTAAYTLNTYVRQLPRFSITEAI